LTKVDVKEESKATSHDKENMELELEELDPELFGIQPAAAAVHKDVSTRKSAVKTKGPVPVEAKLWVEKYKPKGYMDLLSEQVGSI